MRKFIFLLASILVMSSFSASAQKYGTTADSTECKKYLSFYTEHFKQKNYELAIPNWRKAYKYCPPEASQNMLINGTSMVRILINKNAKNEKYRRELIDTLITLHELRAETYPKYKVTALNNKGLDIVNYIKNDSKYIYQELSEIIAENKSQTRPSIFVNHFNAAIDLYNNGAFLSAEDVMELYSSTMEYLKEAPTKTEKEQEEVDEIKRAVETLFIASKVASCENLLELYTPRYAAAPKDLDLAKSIVQMMQLTEGCTNNDLFLNAVLTVYNGEKSHGSAYSLYRLYSSRGDVDNAIKYLQEAVDYVESDSKVDASYLFEMAAYAYKSGRNVRAYEAAQQVVNLDPDLAGKAYLLMGTIWGTLTCSGNEIESRAKFWVATDMMNRAKSADSTLTEEANRYISQYSVYYPEVAEAFMYDVVDGQSYTVSCGGLRATTTVRTRK